MSPTVTGAGVELRCEQHGSGSPVLLIHDMAADLESLVPLANTLAGQARVIIYSRRGYGGSQAPEPYNGTTADEQARDALAILEQLAPAGAVVAGEGFGALVAIELLRRCPELVPAALLIDPPLLAFVPEGTRALGEQREQIRIAVELDGPGGGVEAWLAGRADERRLERAREDHRAFFADYAGLASLEITRRELRAISQPLVVLTGPRTPAPTGAAADALAGLAPQARRVRDGDATEALRSLL